MTNAAAELRATKILQSIIKKTFLYIKRRKPGIWYHTSTSYELLFLLQQRKIYLAEVQETANSSAYSHIFNFQRRGPPQRRGHGNCCRFATLTVSAPRSPYLLCLIMDHRKDSELEQTHGTSYRKISGVDGAPCCRFGRGFGFFFLFFVGNAAQV